MLRSLRARVTLGLLAVALTFGLVTLVAITSLTRLGGAVSVLLQENYRSVIACEDMKEALEREDSAIRFAGAGHDEIARPMLRAAREAFARAFETEHRNITLPGEREAVTTIADEHRDYVTAADALLATPLDGARNDRYFRELLARFAHSNDAVQRVLRMNQGQMEAADREARAVARRGIVITWSAAALALLLALAVSRRVPAVIVEPVQVLADTASRIGTGDLDVTIAEPGVRELDPLVGAFRTMVEQLRAYRASSLGELLDARELAEATVRCLLDPVVVLARDGAVLLANDAASETFGLRTGSAAELRASEVVPPAMFVQARDRVAATGERASPRTLAEAVRFGDRDYLVRAAPLRGGHAERGQAIVIAQDVTRLRRIDALKSEMVATVSHEFKTPLTSLRMATHLLLETATGPLNEGQREVVTAARDDTERLRLLVDELLDLVRIENEAGELHRARVDPRVVIGNVIDAHRTIARDKGVHLVSVAADLGLVTLDAEKIAIVIANLVSNAIRHTPPGGTVTLSTARSDGAIAIVVRDTGTGIGPDDAAHLLERSGASAILPRAGRQGLGLTIAQEIVLQHGGELLVHASAGGGSEFVVRLPDTAAIDPIFTDARRST